MHLVRPTCLRMLTILQGERMIILVAMESQSPQVRLIRLHLYAFTHSI